MKEVPIWEKTTLTLDEAAAYTGIGVCRLRAITDDENFGWGINVLSNVRLSKNI